MTPARIGLGTAALASSIDGPIWCGEQDRDVAIATVVAAIEAGVAFIDTAPFYGWGLAELIVAEALASATSRPPIYTKCGTVRNADGSFREDTSPVAIRADVYASLERLGVDCVDVVQIHDPCPDTPIEESWEALMTLREEGVIGAAGLSNHDPALLDRARRVGPVAVVQHQYSLLHREPEDDGTLAWARAHDVPFLAWSPLASGFLSDGFDLAPLHPADLRRRLPWATSAATETMRRRVRELADRHGTTMAHVAITWLCHQGATPIVGARRVEELAEHLREPVGLTDRDLGTLDPRWSGSTPAG